MGVAGTAKLHRIHEILKRRPICTAAVFFALGVTLGRYFGFKTVYMLLASVISAVAVLLAAFTKKRLYKHLYKFILPLVCAALFFLAAFLSASALTSGYLATGESLYIKGRVYNSPYHNEYGSTICLLDNASVEGRQCGCIKLYLSSGEVRCGDVIEAVADVESPKGVRNPGGFDERLYLKSQGITLKAYADSAKTAGRLNDAYTFFAGSRENLSSVIDGIFDSETAPVAKAMLLGDTQGIDEETYTAFKDTGMAHVLAVSGLNAAILIGFVYFALKLLRAGRNARLIIALAFVAAYTCLTGFTPSIVRAAVMSCAVLLGTHFGRQNDTLNYLSLAFILSLLIRPLDLFTAGFQLSFAAVFGMLTIGNQARRLWDRALKKRLKRTGNALAASAGATAGTMPILAASFNRLSTLSILVNLVIIPLASATTVLVFIAALFGVIFGSSAAFAAFPASAAIKAMLYIIRLAAQIPFVAVNIPSPSTFMVIACFVLMYICSTYTLAAIKTKAAICLSLAAAVAVFAVLPGFNGMYVVFLDSGQGDAAFIRTVQNGEYFIDGGREASAEEIVSFTIRNGYTPEAAFVSHTDGDHFSGIKALYDAGLLGKVYCSWQEESDVRAAMPNAEVVALGAGDTVQLDEYTSALVLYPYKDTEAEDKNSESLVLLIEYNGKRLLFSADIPGTAETEIFACLPRIDVYKASHHGSRMSSYRLPLSVIRPRYSVICVGKKRYGQPDELATDNLYDYSGKVFTTMDDAAVEFYISGDIKVNTYGG
ncbi:MAG: DNA internalization-related competence protein ComEC/Rec2 [Burkholderiales bacterium]